MTLSYADYDALPGVRSSRLRLMASSPLHYREAEDRDTASRGMLRAVHAWLLEGAEAMRRDFAVFDGPVRRGKVWDAFKDAHVGKTILNPNEKERAKQIAMGFRRHAVAGELLRAEGACEEAISWTHEATGLPCKARLDKRIGNTILDLKVYGTSNPREIGRRVAQLGAHIQAAHYCDALRVRDGVELRDITYLLVVAEDRAPYDVAVVELTHDDALALGRVERERLLVRVAECEASGVWPGRCPVTVPLELPAWADPLLDGGDAVSFTEE